MCGYGDILEGFNFSTDRKRILNHKFEPSFDDNVKQVRESLVVLRVTVPLLKRSCVAGVGEKHLSTCRLLRTSKLNNRTTDACLSRFLCCGS